MAGRRADPQNPKVIICTVLPNSQFKIYAWFDDLVVDGLRRVQRSEPHLVVAAFYGETDIFCQVFGFTGFPVELPLEEGARLFGKARLNPHLVKAVFGHNFRHKQFSVPLFREWARAVEAVKGVVS